MIRTIRVSNFRSFRSAEVEFSPTGLTVVVGANGSGKSNLIKVLDFIGSIAREGLDATVRAQGLVEGIVPKSIPIPELRSSAITLEYEVTLPPFAEYPSDGPELVCSHLLTLRARGTRYLEVASERLTFSEPLLVQELLAKVGDSEKRLKMPKEWAQSSLVIERTAKEGLRVEAHPPVNAENVDLYLGWLGLSFIGDVFKKDSSYHMLTSTVARMFENVTREQQKGIRPRALLNSLMDPGGSSLISFSSEAQALQSYLRTIRKYDMHLAELRQQQTITSSQEIGADGSGMPAALRYLRSSAPQRAAWRRLSDTLRDIAPHILDASVSQLRSGEEFVQFVERRTGRAVESWHASDGTLRALAILLALETQTHGVLLIEEPEQGLHPWAVRTLVAHIREVVRERGIQVVITTHSQQVLESVEASEVVLSSRTTDGGSRLQALSSVLTSSTLEPGDIGRLWVDGLLGAVPSYESAV